MVFPSGPKWLCRFHEHMRTGARGPCMTYAVRMATAAMGPAKLQEVLDFHKRAKAGVCVPQSLGGGESLWGEGSSGMEGRGRGRVRTFSSGTDDFSQNNLFATIFVDHSNHALKNSCRWEKCLHPPPFL